MLVEDLVEAVRGVVNGVDPVGLLAIGAPRDEYAPEIHEFARRLHEGEEATAEMVRSVLIRWFGSDTVIPEQAVEKIAKGLSRIPRP